MNAAHRRRTLTDDELGGGAEPPARTTTPAQTLPRSVESHVDGGLVEAVRNRPRETPQGDGVFYVGMNETSAPTEVKALQEAAPGQVTAIFGRPGAKVETKFGKHTYDLTKFEDVHAFAKGLVDYYGLPDATAAKVEKLLLSVTEDSAQGRDELGKIALYMARAESGGTPMPSRLILSGHSVAGSLYGEALTRGQHVGKFSLDNVRELADIFPAAARQIEDIHFGACFSEAQLEKNELWKKSFPNMKTMWGYSGLSPTAPVGDIRTWERATRGHVSNLPVDTFRARTGAMGWSATGGLTDPLVSTSELRARATTAASRYDALLGGETRIREPSASPAREDYAAYRSLSSRPGVTAAERAEYTHRADVLFRVRFYESGVRKEFQKAHGAEVGSAFAALGLPIPDFSKLSRKEAMERIDDFRRAALEASSVDLTAAAAHLDALASLDPTSISEDWCHE